MIVGAGSGWERLRLMGGLEAAAGSGGAKPSPAAAAAMDGTARSGRLSLRVDGSREGGAVVAVENAIPEEADDGAMAIAAKVDLPLDGHAANRGVTADCAFTGAAATAAVEAAAIADEPAAGRVAGRARLTARGLSTVVVVFVVGAGASTAAAGSSSVGGVMAPSGSMS